MQEISITTAPLPLTPAFNQKCQPNPPLARALVACIFTSQASKVKKIIKYARSLSLDESEIRQACIDKGDYFSDRTLTDLFNCTLTTASNAKQHFIKRIIHEMFEVKVVMNTARLWCILKQWDLLNNHNADPAALIFDVADNVTDWDKKAHLYLFILVYQTEKKLVRANTFDKMKAIFFECSLHMQIAIAIALMKNFEVKTGFAQWGWSSALQVLMQQPKLNVKYLSSLLQKQPYSLISEEQFQTLSVILSKPLDLTDTNANLSRYFSEILLHHELIIFTLYSHFKARDQDGMDLLEAFSKYLENQLWDLKKLDVGESTPITKEIFDYICRLDTKNKETYYLILKKILFDLKEALHHSETPFDPLRFRGFASEVKFQKAQSRRLIDKFSQAKDTRFNYEHSFESFDWNRRKRKPRFNVKDAEFKVASSLLKARHLERNVFNLVITSAHEIYRRCLSEAGKSAIRYKALKCFLRFIPLLNVEETIEDLIHKFDLSLPQDKANFEWILNRMSESCQLVHNSRLIALHVKTLITIWNRLNARTQTPLSIVPLLKNAASLQTCALNQAFGFYIPILEIEPSDEVYDQLATCIKSDEVDIPFAFLLCTTLLKKKQLTSEEIGLISNTLRQVTHESNEFEAFVNFLKNLVAYCKRNPIDTTCFQEPIINLLKHPFLIKFIPFNPNQLEFIGVLPSNFTLTSVLDIIFNNLPEDQKDQIKRDAESVIFRMAYLNPFIVNMDSFTLKEIIGYRRLFQQVYDKLSSEPFCSDEIKSYWEYFQNKVNEWPDSLIQISKNPLISTQKIM